MGLFSNPVARREWIQARRRWKWWVGVVLSVAVLEVARRWALAAVIARLGSPAFWIYMGFLVFGALRAPLFVAAWVVCDSIQREREGGGWEDLAMTGLPLRDIVLGKLVVPVLVLSGLGFVLAGFNSILFLRQFCGRSGPGAGEWEVLVSAGVAADLVEGVLFCLMASVVSFRVGWNRPFGEGFLRSIGILLSINLAIAVGARVMMGLSILVLSSFGQLGNSPVTWSVQTLAFQVPFCVVEAAVVVWAFRSSVAALRSGLAEGGKGG